jgi:hypothetical protein
MSQDPRFQQQTSREAVRVGRKGVGAALREFFDGTTHEPVPDQWLALLRRADNTQRTN